MANKNSSTDTEADTRPLDEVRDDFIAQWGAFGSQWVINRTMAQIHALLMTGTEALSTDEVMENLGISRGNAHTNLKELVNWGLIRIVTRKGERKEYFEAELDVWEIFRRIVTEDGAMARQQPLDIGVAYPPKGLDELRDVTSMMGFDRTDTAVAIDVIAAQKQVLHAERQLTLRMTWCPPDL